MSALVGAGTFALGALGSWFMTDFVRKPINTFRDIRAKVIKETARFANLKAQWHEDRQNPATQIRVEEFTENDAKRLDEAQTVFRDLAAEMQSFVDNQRTACWVLERLWRYRPIIAAAGLFGISNSIGTYGGERAFHKERVADALRLPR